MFTFCGSSRIFIILFKLSFSGKNERLRSTEERNNNRNFFLSSGQIKN